jgi:quercetin dioxygenase-like cupin family protein
MSGVRRFAPQASGGFGWAEVEPLQYKEQGSAPFRDITRQVLFAQPDQDCELRYFEISPAGYSTLERHQHTHAVLILRGRGTVRLGATEQPVAEHDLVTIDPLTWHQFRAAADCPLGFLCLVSKARDRPQLPAAEEESSQRNFCQPGDRCVPDGEDSGPN